MDFTIPPISCVSSLTKPRWWASNQPCSLWMSFWGCCGLKAGSIAAFLSLPPSPIPTWPFPLSHFLSVSATFCGGPITGAQFPWISPMGGGSDIGQGTERNSHYIYYIEHTDWLWKQLSSQALVPVTPNTTNMCNAKMKTFSASHKIDYMFQMCFYSLLHFNAVIQLCCLS